MFALIILFALLEQQSQDGAELSDEQRRQAIDWLLADRIARDDLTAPEAESLMSKYQALSDRAVRILVLVQEQLYGIRAPFLRKLDETVDPVERVREGLVAYRIVYDDFTAEQAKEFAEMLDGMSTNQIHALERAYARKMTEEQQRRSQAQRTGAPETKRPDREDAEATLREVQERQAFEKQRREMALQRSDTYRAQTAGALDAANRAGTASARSVNQRLAQQRASTTRMYERKAVQSDWSGSGYWRW